MTSKHSLDGDRRVDFSGDRCPAIPGVLAVFAMLGAAAPPDPEEEECPQGNIVVKALRFSEGPPAYSFMVTNNGARPIGILTLGTLDDTFIAAQFETVPTSVGSPDGWEGMHVFAQDPRLPDAHSHSLIAYLWTTEEPNARIQPGQSLSGFSVQFPVPKKDPSGKERGRPARPDMANIPFLVDPYGVRCPIVGAVEPDATQTRATGLVAPQIPADESQRRDKSQDP